MENPPNLWQKIKKFFDTASWVLLFLFAPYTILIFLSQNAGPGDLLYPFKRGLEGMILIASSVHPTTKAFFRSDLAERRFSEAEELLLTRTDTSALDAFVYEMYEVQKETAGLSDQTKKTELTQKLIAQIDQYQARLERVEERVQNTAAVSRIPQPQSSTQKTNAPPIVDKTTTSEKKPTQKDSSDDKASNQTPQSSFKPTPTPLQSPIQDRPLATFSPTPSPLPPPPPPPPPPNPIIDDIDRVQDELDRIRDDLQAQAAHPPAPTPTIEPQTEREGNAPDQRREFQEERQDERREEQEEEQEEREEERDERQGDRNNNGGRGHN